jgi:hypothetical protein
MTFRAWAKATLIKAVKTAAQTAVALLGVDQTQWLNVDLKVIAATSGMAGVVCILHNISSDAPVQVVSVIPSGAAPVVSDLADPLAVGAVPDAAEDTDVDHTVAPVDVA